MKRINKINHNYFDNIDDEYKAYILGFIYADGCVTNPSTKDKERQLRLQINIQEEDGYILEKLMNDVANRSPIRIFPPAKQKAGEKPQMSARISSNVICNNLISYGCNIRKSVVGMKFPVNISNDLICHFIRGFFDGDGCIYVSKVKNNHVIKSDNKTFDSFTGTLRKRIIFCSIDLEFLKEIDKTIRNKCELKYKTSFGERVKTNTTHSMIYTSAYDVDVIYNFLYKDANFYLKRKKEKFIMSISSQATDASVEGSEASGEVKSS